uniref:Ceramide glucosyltransferase n=1 Tax=Glossina palpalis gambiensis TaxID=67801 RepID=A0A1B0C4E5_9MUSC
YELLFCVEDKTDPAIQLVESLTAKYPQVEASIFLGGSNVGVNPKINNMHPGYEAAKYELVMISDSGIKSKYVFRTKQLKTKIAIIKYTTDSSGKVEKLCLQILYANNLIKVTANPWWNKEITTRKFNIIHFRKVYESLLLTGISSGLELITEVGRSGGPPVDTLANFRSETFSTLENSDSTYVEINVTTRLSWDCCFHCKRIRKTSKILKIMEHNWVI